MAENNVARNWAARIVWVRDVLGWMIEGDGVQCLVGTHGGGPVSYSGHDLRRMQEELDAARHEVELLLPAISQEDIERVQQHQRATQRLVESGIAGAAMTLAKLPDDVRATLIGRCQQQGNEAMRSGVNRGRVRDTFHQELRDGWQALAVLLQPATDPEIELARESNA